MQLDMLIMPNLAKMEFSMNQNIGKMKCHEFNHFISNDIYTTGPIIFSKEVTGLDEVSYTTYIALNDEIEAIPELNIEYVPSLEVFLQYLIDALRMLILIKYIRTLKTMLLKMM